MLLKNHFDWKKVGNEYFLQGIHLPFIVKIVKRKKVKI